MTTIQIVLLCLMAGILQVDVMTVALGPSNTIICGILAGLIMGNPKLGLLVGATLQSYALGLGYFGGASIPNYQIAAIIVVGLCGNDIDNIGTTISLIGIPVAALTVQLDVLGRIINSFWAHKEQALITTGNRQAMFVYHLCGISTWSLTRLVPVLVCLLIGPDLVTALNSWLPVWLTQGLKIASGIFPAIGFAILLRYMPLKGNYQYVIFGFVLSAYFGASSIVAAAIGLGLALFVYYRNDSDKPKAVESNEGGNYDE